MFFGIKRRNLFGASECSKIPRPHTTENCTLHKVDGKYPCFLTSQGCRVRQDKDLDRTSPYYSAVNRRSGPQAQERNVPRNSNSSNFVYPQRCHELPNNEGCSMYFFNGEYPCFTTKTGCRKRVHDKQPRSNPYVKKGKKIPTQRPSTPSSSRNSETTFRGPVIKRENSGTTIPFYGPFFVSTGNLSKNLSNSPVVLENNIIDEGLDYADLNALDFGKRRNNGSALMKKNGKKLIIKYSVKKFAMGKKKIPAALRKKCKKYKIKLTRKVGRRRVYKSIAVLKKQLKMKMKRLFR